ncbi:MAG: hypothetical protein RIT04_154 [Candidatus Parcubacteria bacterium]|jgi:sugar-specific transcriptional regulator TrmB
MSKAKNTISGKEGIIEVLTSLDISPISQKIYLSLLGNKSLTARMLGEIVNIPRPSVYDHIRLLQQKNLILSKKQDGKTFFFANDPNTIQMLLDQKQEQYEKAKKIFTDILPVLHESGKTVEPKIQFFSGVEGIKSVQNDILWSRDIETYTLWPTQRVIDLLGYDYITWHNRRRIEENISVKVIRQGKVRDEKKHPLIIGNSSTLRTVKYLPTDLGIHMSYWIYGEKVAFFDSSPELFGFIVHSKSFAHLMKVHFDFLWSSLK